MGHFAAVKIASDETDERFCVLEATLAAGGGFTSRLHRHHKYVESWFVADGTLEFCSGNETLLAPAGSFVLAPPSAPHTFGNSGPEETRIVAFYMPGGMDRFIAELGKLRSMDEPGFKAFATLFDRYDTEPADPERPGGNAGARHRSRRGRAPVRRRRHDHDPGRLRRHGRLVRRGRLHGAAGLPRPAAPPPPRDRRRLLRARGRVGVRNRERRDRSAARDAGVGRARDGAQVLEPVGPARALSRIRLSRRLRAVLPRTLRRRSATGRSIPRSQRR